MKPIKTFLVLVVLLSITQLANAQDKMSIKFGKVTPQDFDVKPPVTDSGANAIVVADWGNSDFVANTSDLSVSLEFTRKTRIKIVNKNGFDAAKVDIHLYVSGSISEKLEGLRAYTYNLEDGKVVETKVESSAVFSENLNKNWVVKKFTFPALKEGSIIEYSYTIKSPFFFNLQSWEFQGEYPCLWSEYDAGIPEFYKYVTLSQGYQSFFINKNDQSRVQFSFRYREEAAQGSVGGFGGAITRPTTETFNIEGAKDNHRWVMKDVPGLKVEPFTTTLNNHIAKIEFQLSQIWYPNSTPHFFMSDWKKVAEEMRDSDKFGSLINRPNNWLGDDLKMIIGNASAADEKARKIFQYLRNNFSCKSTFGVYASTNLKDVLKNKSGSVADINLLLVAMLRFEKIEANPVILGTRSRGITHELYPLMDRFNYLIVKAIIDDQPVFLDASQPKIAYGKLPIECYNGHAREFTNEVLQPVYFYPDSLKESSFTGNTISNDEKTGKLIGGVMYKMGYYSSLNLRKELSNISLEEYKKQVKAALPEDMEVENFEIDSLKNYDEPIAVRFDTKYNMFGENDIVYFNPLIDNIIKKNPFTAAQRFYPVERPYTEDAVYSLTMEIPKGYVVDELPKSTRLKLNEDEGMFEYIIRKDDSYIQMRVRLVINKANFANEDYETLRNFYSFIVKKEAEQIVFKKVK